MATSELKDQSGRSESESSVSDTCESSDSEGDPDFDILEDTRASFSRLSVKKKAKARLVSIHTLCKLLIYHHIKIIWMSGFVCLYSRCVSKEMVEETEGVPKLNVPGIDKEDQKDCDIVQQMIEGL